MPSFPTILAFDLYGTLLSTSSISTHLASHFGRSKASAIATTWRTLQLEYTWRLNSMSRYIPFSTLTRNSLAHALSSHGESLSDADTEALMKAYDELETFEDVGDLLKALKGNDDMRAVVFSNGTQEMVMSSVKESPGLGRQSAVFGDIITVDEISCYKPDPRVYEHLARKVGMEGRKEEIWLVSGNPFDVVGARAVGMQAVWVDREGMGWQDRLLQGEEMGKPTIVVKGLEDVVEKVEEWLQKH